MASWLRVCLAMQQTLAPSLIWEDSTLCRALNPRATEPEPEGPEPTLCNKRSPRTAARE